MKKYLLKKTLIGSVLMLGLPFLTNTIYAATAIDLSHQPISVLKTLLIPSSFSLQNKVVTLEEISRSIDFNQTLHIRLQEKYLGHAVWGGDFIVHVPHGEKDAVSLMRAVNSSKNHYVSMTGTLYEDIQQDLNNLSTAVPGDADAKLALKQAINMAKNHYQESKTVNVQDEKSELIIYMDKANKAHWAFKVSFLLAPTKEGMIPVKPVYLMDATTFEVYAKWNDVKNLNNMLLADAAGGGLGGNKKMGKLVYDGLNDHLPKLAVDYDAKDKTCYWRNTEVNVKSYKTKKTITFSCKALNPDHNNIYWNDNKDKVNGGFGPANDALFAGAVIKDMYQTWYHVPVLVNDDGSPMMLTMVVHVPQYDNAYWDGQQMTFGDGYYLFYPLTSLGVAAHEISHGFTEQHADLAYYGQSGGMNESFSDMAAQAAEFYAYGRNSWQIGPEIFKPENAALRYMDQPSKDCLSGNEPGQDCSIDHASQYHDDLDVHFSSGVFNRLFYLMGSANHWDPKKAFDVMVHANQYYWTSTSTFQQGACGVIKATTDLSYDVDVVKQAIHTVGIDISHC